MESINLSKLGRKREKISGLYPKYKKPYANTFEFHRAVVANRFVNHPEAQDVVSLRKEGVKI